MNDAVTDTMALILRLERRRMGSAAKAAFEQAEAGVGKLYVPAMALVELGYLSERKRIITTLDAVKVYLSTHPSIEVAPMTSGVIEAAFAIDDISELHDRLIAATAKTLDIPLLTNDSVIRESSHLKTLW